MDRGFKEVETQYNGKVVEHEAKPIECCGYCCEPSHSLVPHAQYDVVCRNCNDELKEVLDGR